MNLTINTNIGREEKANYYIIADHLRTTIFALADGASFEPKGRGYILKKLIKKTALLSYLFRFTVEDLVKISEKLIEINSFCYPHLKEKEGLIIEEVRKETSKSLKLVNNAAEKLNSYYSPAVTPREIFFWYDTQGIPLELIQTYFQQHNHQFPHQEFDKLLTEQKKRSLTDRKKKNISTF
jgi:alanyl-tRNA synthetase